MLYILFKEGILEEDLQLLLHHANLKSRACELPLRNLDLLGPFTLTKSFAEHKAASKNRKRPKASNSDEDSYELSRFVPPIKTTLENVINGTLDHQTWAYTMDQPPETQPIGQQGSLRRYPLRLNILIIVNDRLGRIEGKHPRLKLDNGLLCLLSEEQHIQNPARAMKFPRNGTGTSY